MFLIRAVSLPVSNIYYERERHKTEALPPFGMGVIARPSHSRLAIDSRPAEELRAIIVAWIISESRIRARNRKWKGSLEDE